MTRKSLATLFLAATLGAGSALALADSSTGTTAPANPGTLPADKGGATGTGTGSLPNRNTDGSTASNPKPHTNTDVSTPQSSDTRPTNGKTGMGGTGSEGTGTDK
ncbi:hypothetical protein [Pseudomonas massiliensis]|uniref:hypothetical protein n=1 Tax=Pseudomonas massiliensis TaxID=522492 RepID=UPI00058B355B|nr:hypothetical protein [Pseudomonas massiliensis]